MTAVPDSALSVEVVHLFVDGIPDPSELPAGARLEVTGDQSPLAELRGRPPAAPPFAALVWADTPLVGADGVPLGDACWRVERRVRWDDGPGDADPTGWVKQTSLVRRPPDLDPATFAERYLGHAEVARAHHGMWRYAQSLVVEVLAGDPESAADGISELWFADRADWLDRFYLAPDSPAAVRADTERFIDFTRTASANTTAAPTVP